MFTHDSEDGVWSEQITAHFTAPPGVRLGLDCKGISANSLSDLPAWFRAVQASPAFQIGAGLTGWSFKLRIDGC